MQSLHVKPIDFWKSNFGWDLPNDKVDSLVAYTNKPKSDSEKIVALKKDISSEESSKLLKDAYVKNITLTNEISRLMRLYCQLAIYHGWPNNGHVKVNNGLKTAILNLIKSKFFKCILSWNLTFCFIVMG